MERTEKDFLDFGGGINQYDSDLLLKDNECQDARNVYSDGRALYKRRGFREFGTEDTSYNVITTFPYKNSQGASYLLKVHSDGSLYTILAPPEGSFDIDESTSASDANDPHTNGETYHYFIRYVDYDGRKSLPSKINSFTVSDGTKAIDLTSLPIGADNIWYKEIFRSNHGEYDFHNVVANNGVTGGTWASIPNNTTSFLDEYGTWDYTDDATNGQLILGENLMTDSSYENKETDHHGIDVSIDVTGEVNFVLHKDWAIVCNGIDRYKWRAPKKLAEIKHSFEERSGAHLATGIQQLLIDKDSFNSSEYAPCMHIKLVKPADISADVFYGDIVNVADISPYVLAMINCGTTASPVSDDAYANYTIVTVGECIPFGVPNSDLAGSEIFINEVGASGLGSGSYATGGEIYTYKICSVNMNGSEGAPVTTDQVTLGAGKEVLLSMPPLDWTSIYTSGNITITQDSPDTNYAKVESTSAFSQTLEAGAADGSRGTILYFQNDSDVRNHGMFRVVGGTINGVDCTPNSTVFYIWNPDAITDSGITPKELRIHKINRSTAYKLYRTDTTGAAPFYHLKKWKGVGAGALDTASGQYSILADTATFEHDRTTWEVPTGLMGGVTKGDVLTTAGFTNPENNGSWVVMSAEDSTLTVRYQGTMIDEGPVLGSAVTISAKRIVDWKYFTLHYDISWNEYDIRFFPVERWINDGGEDLTGSNGILFSYGTTIANTQLQAHDDPPRFKYGTSVGGRIVAGNLNFDGLTTGQRDGVGDIGVFNLDEVESMYYLNWTPLVTLGDTSNINAVSYLANTAIVGTSDGVYTVSGVADVATLAPVIKMIDNQGCFGHRTFKRVSKPSGEVSVIYLGKDGLYEIVAGGKIGTYELSIDASARPLGSNPSTGSGFNHRLKRLYYQAITSSSSPQQNIVCAATQISEAKYIVNIKKDSESQNDISVVYDFRDDAFWIYDNFNARDMCFWEDRLVHASGGNIYIEQTANNIQDFMDDGVPIESWLETKYMPMDGMSFVKKWDKITLYPNEDNNYQAINVGTKAEFADSSTSTGRAAKTLPDGFTSRGVDLYNGGAWTVTVSHVSGNTYRYTSSGATTISDSVVVGDRVQIWKGGSNGFAYENLGDFAVTNVSTNYFEVTNASGKAQSGVALQAAGDIIFYYADGTENNGLNYMYKNAILNTDRDAFRLSIAPSSARFMRFRFENVFSTQKLAIGGYTIRYGINANKGLDR